MEADILAKEKQSVKTPFFHIDNLLDSGDTGVESAGEKPITFDSDKNVYRLFRMNRLMNHLHREKAIPFRFKSIAPITAFDYDDLKNKFTKLDYRDGQYFKLRLEKHKSDQSFTLHHSALYKVDYLKFRHEKSHSGSLLWRHHQMHPYWERSKDASKFESMPAPTDVHKNLELKDVYVWGIELIAGLKNYSIMKLKLSEEISYYQRKAFKQFVEEIYTNSAKAPSKCQSDILEMILDNFTLKLNQRVFNS